MATAGRSKRSCPIRACGRPKCRTYIKPTSKRAGENNESPSITARSACDGWRRGDQSILRRGLDEITMSQRPTSRYDRQARFTPLGEDGQRQLGRGRALVCGCGALGSVVAETLVRAGVGFVRIVDRDFLELNNLQRQVLYDEQDVTDGLPKAIAAANKLRRINTEVQIEPAVADVTHHNIGELAADVDVIVDGTDNFGTRFLLNDFAVKHGKPWVYGGCIGAEGQTMT